MARAVIVLLCLLKLVSGLTDNDKWCIQDFPDTLDNTYLLGTWYEVYKFAPNLNLPSSSWCAEINITTTTSDDVNRYLAAHGSNEPLKFDTSAVLYERNLEGLRGMLTGGDEVKFFAFDPDSVFFGTRDYYSYSYRRINDDYLLYSACNLASTKFIWSRRNDQTLEELEAIIATVTEVKNLQTQRFCD